MSSFLAKAKGITLDILFPPLCLVCQKALAVGEKETAICANCFTSIPINNTLTCPICRARLADNKKICHLNSSFRLAAASSYDNDIVKGLIWQLKYQRQTAASSPLAQILLEHLRTLDFNLVSYEIMPVPLHQNRERKRGFNQSELIAASLSKKINLPINAGALKRVKDTPPQAETKDFEEREKNMANSFLVIKPEFIKSRKIILVDDVFTSGATLTAAVLALKAAGAGRVIGLVVAKAG